MAKKSSRTKASSVEPRRKTTGDEVYNLRRRLKRRAARERARGLDALADRLEQLAARTYAQKGATGNVKRLENVRAGIDAAREGLLGYLKVQHKVEQAQKRARERQKTVDEWRQQGINVPKSPREQAEEQRRAKRDDFNMRGPEQGGSVLTDEPPEEGAARWEGGRVESNLTRAEEQALFSFTRDIWRGAPRSEREKIVMQHFKADSLEEVFARTLGQIEARDSEGQIIELAEEEKYQFYRAGAALYL